MAETDPATPAPAIRAVVFDMGGVLVRLGPLEDVLAGVATTADDIAEIGDTAGPDPADLWTRWILADAVRLYERGRCSTEDFAAALISELGLALEPPELIERFRRFPMGLYDGAIELAAEVRATCTVGVLSNTNELHWTGQIDHEIVQAMFDRAYLSYALDMVKPDADIYEHVIADLGLRASEILFIDDNQINVDGALACGMHAALAKGPDQARAALTTFGVLP